MGNHQLFHRIFSLICLVFLFTPSTAAAPVGLCYGRVANNLPAPSSVVDLLKSNGISRVRIFDTDPDVLKAFSGSGINLMIGVPNEILPSIANNNLDFSLQWLQNNVLSHISPTQIQYIAVGNEVFLKDPYYTPFVVPAINNLHQALQGLNLAETIKLSTPHAACVLSNSFPPSAGDFSPNVQSAMIPLLQFLKDTNSPMMINVYPYFSYINNVNDIPLDYALFKSPNILSDRGVSYSNLFDATIDSFVAAMEKAGFGGVRVVVTETGWPKAGGEAATPDNALTYNQNAISRALGNLGTPRRPESGVEVFLFGLFDEDGKNGEACERHFGVFELDGVKAYNAVPHDAFTYMDGQKEFVQINPNDLFPYLLVNIGSGVSIIKVDGDGKYERVSGTSVGGGTFWGLGRLLTKCKSFDELLELSHRGNNRVIDMLVGDIFGGMDYAKIGLSATAIASSFGKAISENKELEDYRPEDVGGSLLRLISNNIGQVNIL
ncbi:hypothetical protein Nepgr_003443 [Nepenthes gracilis]|uniref:Glucan endo-1,3-beta-D-glucosidase n=1 Tax=Nepenthes gracilis TaxID=150966 RepID=A0AAD3XDK7_NEPGR|nr:hypothetical protein Nepgr_003443 [Nepenthes gracilis]